ncbi:MAG TPA: DUF1573 domain-containing protein [Planctomycetota bacterium]|nr:DUF1573 domain-containing protein [Planctomycetota bacterium]
MTLPMRLRAALWAALAVGASLGAPFLAVPAGGDTELVFAPTTFDFGTVRAGTLVRARFEYVNGSRSPIRIRGAHGTCGCVRATASRSYVEPGAKGTIDATLITEGRSGPQKLRIRVQTDEGPESGARLTLSGNIQVALRPRPPRLILGAVAPGSEHTADIRVEKLEPVGSVPLSCRGDGITAEKLDDDETGFTLRVTVKVPWTRGRQGTGVRLGDGGEITWIPVVWQVLPPFEVSTHDVELRGGRAELTAKPRWPGVALARIDTRGLPIRATRDGDRIELSLEGSALDIPGGAWIELVPEPATLGNVTIHVSVGGE